MATIIVSRRDLMLDAIQGLTLFPQQLGAQWGLCRFLLQPHFGRYRDALANMTIATLQATKAYDLSAQCCCSLDRSLLTTATR